MEVLQGDANGAGSETLSTYTALGADVRKFLLTSIFGSTFNIWFNIGRCGNKF